MSNIYIVYYIRKVRRNSTYFKKCFFEYDIAKNKQV